MVEATREHQAVARAACSTIQSQHAITLIEGYAIGAELEKERIAVGWRRVGWKLGFTNQALWAALGLDQPVWIGLGLLWCGIGLRFWSFRTLGRYFTVVVQTSSEQPVISDGPYGVIRHPSYAGLLLAVIGVGLCIGNWWSLICVTVAMTAALVFRIHVEEQALLRDLGEDYRRYAATHKKRLIPFLW